MSSATGLLGSRSEGRVVRAGRRDAATRTAELPESPWNRYHRIRLGVLAALGTVGATVCWYGGSGTGQQDRQVWWLVGSVASLVVILVSGVVWILQGIRAVKRVERELVALLSSAQRVGQAPGTSHDTQRRVTSPGMTRYHLESCQLVSGKPTTSYDDELVLAPCGVCLS